MLEQSLLNLTVCAIFAPVVGVDGNCNGLRRQYLSQISFFKCVLLFVLYLVETFQSFSPFELPSSKLLSSKLLSSHCCTFYP